MTEPAVIVEDLVKFYGKVHAVDGVSLSVPAGTILGMLGPNGAGKTTVIRILTTLLRPDRGRAIVAGYDVVRQAPRLRQVIGLAGQYAAVDETLTGRENLRLVGRLYHLGGREASRRADELLERFDLTDAADRLAKTYSGGMRRRLDLAASLVARPPVLFLDEPTTGLDPRSRFALWDVIRGLVQEGTTLVLTTQYMEEADNLADSIAVMDHGKVIARGTADELKLKVGGEVLDVVVTDKTKTAQAALVLESFAAGQAKVDEGSGRVTIPVRDGTGILPEVVRRLDQDAVRVADLGLHRPTLDDVFLSLTGHEAEQEEMDSAKRGRGRRKSAA